MLPNQTHPDHFLNFNQEVANIFRKIGSNDNFPLVQDE